jgi:hypothetical protein
MSGWSMPGPNDRPATFSERFGFPAAPAAPPANVTNNVTNHFNITGADPKEIGQKVMENMAKAMSDAQNRNQGQAGGLYRSPWDSGASR